MKKLLLLFVLAVLVSCSKSDEPEPDQEYTSFTFVHHSDVIFPGCVVGYYRNGLCHKLAELGDLQKDRESEEVIIEDGSIVDVYLFTDYGKFDEIINGEMVWHVIKADTIYTLKRNILNRFVITEDTKGVYVVKDDPVQYPH
ncbi:MAG: hypothetical protein LBS05_00175 [Tannerellaceae bacterium]|jgi:hypothetical protein|nr:hypothetical protein [Tannerellaceae bacterium]